MTTTEPTAVQTQFTSYFGSQAYGADVSWDISVAGSLNINMVVRTAAQPMIFQSAAASGCTASASNLLCVLATTGPLVAAK
jgi:hypothetical protein